MKIFNLAILATVFSLLCNNAIAIVHYDDGGKHLIDFTINDDIAVVNSTLEVPTKIEIIDNGEVLGGVYSTGESEMKISGGYIYGSVYADDDSIVNICGGSIGYMIFANHKSTIYIHGYNFEIDDQPVDYGELQVRGGRLAGTLLYGDFFDNNLDISTSASIILLPEPSSLLLLSIGAFILGKRK